jgi:hypothetical protein
VPSKKSAPKKAASQKAAGPEPQGASAEDAFQSGWENNSSSTFNVSQFVTGSGTAKMEELLDAARGNPSALENVGRILTEAQNKAAGEYEQLKSRAANIVGTLAEKRFSEEAVKGARPELNQLRGQMAGLRRRLSNVHRKMKMAFVAAGHLGNQGLTSQFASQIASVKSLEPGVDRAVQALQLTAGLYRSSSATQGVRVPLGQMGSMDRHALGSYLAEISPGAAFTQSTLAMLQGGPGAQGGVSPSQDSELHQRLSAGDGGSSWQALANLRDLHAGD